MATLTFVYADSTAVVGPLATVPEPHSWDLCISHAGRITAPRGWELVRHAGPLTVPCEDDDLVALADAVSESAVLPGGWRPARVDTGEITDRLQIAQRPHPTDSMPQRPGRHRRTSADGSRRRGHLRVLPNPPE